MYAVFIETLTDQNTENSIRENADINAYSASDNNEQLADKITILAGQINAANYRFLKLIAEFDRREGFTCVRRRAGKSLGKSGSV
jgi:hypothetical protein